MADYEKDGEKVFTVQYAGVDVDDVCNTYVQGVTSPDLKDDTEHVLEVINVGWAGMAQGVKIYAMNFESGKLEERSEKVTSTFYEVTFQIHKEAIVILFVPDTTPNLYQF